MAYSIKRDWDGPTRKAVPRKKTRNQRAGKVVAINKLARKKAENRYGGSGWDPSKIA
jgi:hypothetical protein